MGIDGFFCWSTTRFKKTVISGWNLYSVKIGWLVEYFNLLQEMGIGIRPAICFWTYQTLSMYKVCLKKRNTLFRKYINLKFVCCLVPRSGVSLLSSQQRRRVETTSKLRRTGFLDPSTFSKAQKNRVLAMANIRQPVNGKKPSKMSTQFKTWLQTCLRWRSIINDMASTRDNMFFAWSGPQQPMLQGWLTSHMQIQTPGELLFCFTLFHDPRCSMYGIFTNICPKNHPNVGKYTIHGASGDFHVGSKRCTFGRSPATSTSLLRLHSPRRSS